MCRAQDYRQSGNEKGSGQGPGQGEKKLCGELVEILPQRGLRQNYLPTKAAFQWQARKWVGLVTRLSSARTANMQNQFVTDERVHFAQLLIVPTSETSWGHGLYVHPGVAPEPVRDSKYLRLVEELNPGILRALGLGRKFEFALPSQADTRAMSRNLVIVP